MSSSGFGGAACFSVFQLWVQEGAAQSALAESCPHPVSESSLHVVVRRQDTSRTRVQVIKPLVGDKRVAQVFDPRNLLPGSFGEECVLQTPQSCQITVKAALGAAGFICCLGRLLNIQHGRGPVLRHPGLRGTIAEEIITVTNKK